MKKVQSLFISVANFTRIGERMEQARKRAMRARIEDVTRRVEAAKARERQARLERKVAPMSEYKKK